MTAYWHDPVKRKPHSLGFPAGTSLQTQSMKDTLSLIEEVVAQIVLAGEAFVPL
jgi:hypothetical protein